MPIHDWTRVGNFVFRDFHLVWLAALRRILNSGVLPEDYYALAEQVTRTMGPDVLALEMPGRPRTPPAGAVSGNPAAVRLDAATSPPRVAVTAVAPARSVPMKQRRLAIRHTSDDRLVAIVELVSPGNKSADYPFRSFVKKAVRALDSGIHLLVFDPFPPGKRDPNGLHGAIWAELGGEPYTQPAGKPLTLASYEAIPAGPRAYVEPLGPGDALADMPLFLEPGNYVAVPMERAYNEAFAELVPHHRALFEPPG